MWGCKLEFRGIKLPFKLCTVIFMHCDLLSALTTTTTPSAWQLAAETCPLRRLMLERKHRVSTKVTAMKSYWMELLFALKNGDFSAISVTERNYAPPILKVESHISDRSCATFWCNVDRYSHRNGNEWVVGARAAIHWNGSKYLGASEDCNRPFRLTHCCTQFKSPGVKILCVLYLHYNVAFTFKWYRNSWNKTFFSQRVWIGYNIWLAELVYRPFPSSPEPLYQNGVKCSAFDMKMIFNSHANKTYFIQKGCALGLILKVRVSETRRWPIKLNQVLSANTTARCSMCVNDLFHSIPGLFESARKLSGIAWILPKDDQSARNHENMLLVTSSSQYSRIRTNCILQTHKEHVIATSYTRLWWNMMTYTYFGYSSFQLMTSVVN